MAWVATGAAGPSPAPRTMRQAISISRLTLPSIGNCTSDQTTALAAQPNGEYLADDVGLVAPPFAGEIWRLNRCALLANGDRTLGKANDLDDVADAADSAREGVEGRTIAPQPDHGA